jgi:hypothetical protein
VNTFIYYRQVHIITLFLFLISSQTCIYTMEEVIEKKPLSLAESKGNFICIPNDVLLLIGLPNNNTYKEIMYRLPVTKKLSKINTYFRSLFIPQKIKEYEDMLDAANAYDNAGATPLIKAIISNEIDDAIRLINNGANIDKADTFCRNNPLYVTTLIKSEEDSIKIAQVLLKYGADVETKTRTQEAQITVFTKVVLLKKFKLASLLMQYRANPYKILINHPDLDLLTLVKKNYGQEIIKFVEDAQKSISKLQPNQLQDALPLPEEHSN